MSTRRLLLPIPTPMRRILKKYFQSKERLIFLEIVILWVLILANVGKGCSGLLLRIASAN